MNEVIVGTPEAKENEAIKTVKICAWQVLFKHAKSGGSETKGSRYLDYDKATAEVRRLNNEYGGCGWKYYMKQVPA